MQDYHTLSQAFLQQKQFLGYRYKTEGIVLKENYFKYKNIRDQLFYKAKIVNVLNLSLQNKYNIEVF